jgi:single-stranded DNA-binding protein
MNYFSVSGRLGGDATLLTTTTGEPYLRFNMAANLSSPKSVSAVDPVWFSVLVFGSQANTHLPVLRKGAKVIVSGSLLVERFKSKDDQHRTSFRIKAQSVDLLASDVSVLPLPPVHQALSDEVPF